MEAIRVGQWVKLALVVAMSFIVISYIFKPSDNQCQMTFMMEPPKFLPIALDTQSYKHGRKANNNYKLFMYSEFGFPLESDIQRDLKDSMPVLFVPGNAGSYQQVRSLASTCIRRQLQSLDAFKFIFYTIDFRAQFSGISGSLIDGQIQFVNLALNQISKMHSIETNGVIVVGHSVGGFIAKALFARPSFDPNLVPLLINLASPLTRSFVNFDDKMRDLYSETNTYWSNRSKLSGTLAISISGGKSDRLVPMHLSLDPHFDISLTTSSIKDVWLTTDHVCITWCRELMQKLVHLLSALMDKRHTRLIDNKQQALSIIETQMLTRSTNYVKLNKDSTLIGPQPVNSMDVQDYVDYFSAKRHELMEDTIILNMTQAPDEKLFIWLEHIDSLKETGLYACKGMQTSRDKPLCDGKINLLLYAKPIPARKFEPKKSVVMLQGGHYHFQYLVIDFASGLRNNIGKNKTPEFVSIQTIKSSSDQSLYIPSLFEYAFRKLMQPSSLKQKIIAPFKAQVTHSNIAINSLNLPSQFYSVIVETGSCQTDDKPAEITVSLSEGEYLSESFHPDKENPTVVIKLSPKRTILKKHSTHSPPPQLSLDFYLDGTCENSIRLEFDLWSYIENFIQNRPSEILACASYLGYASVVTQTLRFMNRYDSADLIPVGQSSSWIFRSVGFLFAFQVSTSDTSTINHYTEFIILFLTTFVLSSGLLALTEHVTNRLLDLMMIFMKCLEFTRELIGTGANKLSKIGGRRSGSSQQSHALAIVNLEFILIGFTVVGSWVFSEALTRLCMLIIILKLELRLEIDNSSKDLPALNKHLKNGGKETQNRCNRDDITYSLLLSIATLCALDLISNIPATMLKISALDTNLSNRTLDANFLISVASLVLIKLISVQVEIALMARDEDRNSSLAQKNCDLPLYIRPLVYLPRQSHIMSLIPIAFINQNICHMNLVELPIMAWIGGSLLKMNLTKKSKRKVD